jgi:hypothetical protein
MGDLLPPGGGRGPVKRERRKAQHWTGPRRVERTEENELLKDLQEAHRKV